MAQDLKQCVIQIRDDSGNIRGTGFVIDANTVVTCAHVVQAAGTAPGDAVTVAFAQTGETCPAEVLPDAWSPVEENDIAILRLQGKLPAGVKPAILWSNEETAGHSFLAFGYPEIRDDKGGVMKGLGAEGKILHLTQDSQNTNILHIDSKNIAPGMSGSPVLDTNIDRVIGMVTMTYNPDSTLKFRDTAFATPVEVIQQVWPTLKLIPHKVEIIEIPFVIVSMTHREASELITETIFNSPNVSPAEKSNFQLFKTTFEKSDITNWLSHYDEDRDNWKPHNYPEGANDTIHTIILNTIDSFNQRHLQTETNSLIIQPQFFSSNFLTTNDEKRIDTWDSLSKSGCVIIVDAISLFHPIIYRRLLHSEMSSNQRVAIAMLVLSAKHANKLIEKEIKTRLQRAFARFDRYNDELCHLDVGEPRTLRRWLTVSLRKVIPKIQATPQITARQIMQKKISKTYGIDNLVLGQWE